MTARLLTGDALTVLRTLPEASVRCCVTSPPYWGLRDYGHAGQLGLEPTPDAYVANMVAVFGEVRRVLTDDGTLWLNLGDSFAGGGRGGNPAESTYRKQATNVGSLVAPSPMPPGLKHKDLVGIPWRVAFALQADGWWLRSDIIWSKAACMPESVRDRPTRSHEYIFLLAKSARYFYTPIREPQVYGDHARNGVTGTTVQAPGQSMQRGITARRSSGNKARKGGEAVGLAPGGMGRSIPWEDRDGMRNARSVWHLNPDPYSGAHFATFPEELARRCILAGSAPGDTVLDPFGGSGTVAAVAIGNGRKAIGIELNPAYQILAEQRIGPAFVETPNDAPLSRDREDTP